MTADDDAELIITHLKLGAMDLSAEGRVRRVWKTAPKKFLEDDPSPPRICVLLNDDRILTLDIGEVPAGG